MDNLTIEQRLYKIDKQISELNKKLDKILLLVTPNLSELQEQDVAIALFKSAEENFEYNLRDIENNQDNFNENTDDIINKNKLI